MKKIVSWFKEKWKKQVFKYFVYGVLLTLVMVVVQDCRSQASEKRIIEKIEDNSNPIILSVSMNIQNLIYNLNLTSYPPISATDLSSEEIKEIQTSDDDYVQGLLSLYQGNYPAALLHMNKSLSKGDDNLPRKYFYLGNIYFKLKENPEAEQMYKKSLSLEPNAYTYANLGLIYLVEDRYSEAAYYLSEASKLRPEYPINQNLAYSLHALGVIEANKTNLSGAIQYYDLALNLSNVSKTLSTTTRFNKANLLMRFPERYDEALMMYEQLLNESQDREHELVYMSGIANAYFLKKNLNASEEEFSKILQRDPKNEEATRMIEYIRNIKAHFSEDEIKLVNIEWDKGIVISKSITE